MTESERKYRQDLSDRISTYYYDPRDVAKELRSPQKETPGSFDKKYLNFYLGLPKSDSSFVKSQYLPAGASPNETYYTPKDRESLKRNALNSYFGRFSGSKGVGKSGHNVTLRMKGGEEDLGDFTIGSGVDDRGEYISVYDRWDTNPMGLESKGYAGPGNQKSYYAPQSYAINVDKLNNPFSIYDRFYFDEMDSETINQIKKEHERSNITPMNRRTKKYNTGGTYQPVGLPVDPAEIRRQKEEKRKQQGNFWTGLAQFATQYVAPMVAGPLGSTIGRAVNSIGMAQRSSTTEGPGNYAQDITPVVANQELQLNPNQGYGFNYGGPITPPKYMPTITNPTTSMMTATATPMTGVQPMGYQYNLQNQLAPMQPSGWNNLTVGHPGPVNANTYANIKEGASNHVKSKDRYWEKQYGGSFQVGGPIDPPKGKIVYSTKDLDYINYVKQRDTRAKRLAHNKEQFIKNYSRFGISRAEAEKQFESGNYAEGAKGRPSDYTDYLPIKNGRYDTARFDEYPWLYNNLYANIPAEPTPVKVGMKSFDPLPIRSGIISNAKVPKIYPKHSVIENGQRVPISDRAYNNLMQGELLDEYKTGRIAKPNDVIMSKFKTGGDIKLNSNAFQVQGNSQQVDGNMYNMGDQQVALDHNEVVVDKFVFSDSLTNPLTGNKFSKDAKMIEKSIGKSEKKVNMYNDLIANKTAKYSNMMSDDLKAAHEMIATIQGHRNQDGSTKQNYATGGEIQGDPEYILVRPGKRKPELGIYYDPSTDTYLSRNSLGKYNKVSSDDAQAYRSLYPPSTLVAKQNAPQAQQPTTSAAAQQPPINTLGGYFDPSTNKVLKRNSDGSYMHFGSIDSVGEMLGVSRQDNVLKTQVGNYTLGTPTPPVNTIGGYIDAAMRQKVEPADSPLDLPPLENVSAPVVTSTSGKKSTAKKANSDYSYDPIKQGPLTINNNPQGMSVPTTGNKFLDIQSKDVFGQYNPTATEKTIPYSDDAISKPLSKLPFVRNGQAGAFVNNMSQFIKTDPYGNAYPADTKFPLPSEMTSLREAAGFNAQGQPVPPTATPPIDNANQDYNVPFTAGDALQAVAVGSKFFQALSPVEVEPTRSNTAPISRETYDPRSSLYQNQRNFQNSVNSLQAGSLNTRRAIANQALSSKLNADSQVLDRYNQMNVAAGTQYEQRLGQRQAENIGYANYASDLNARNRAARANNLDVAFNSLGYFGQGLNQKKQAKDALNVYKQLFPNVSKNVLDSLTKEDLLKILKGE